MTLGPLDTTQTLAFERDRSNATTMLLLCASFVALGAWFVVSPATFAESSVARALARIGPSPRTVIVIVGVLAIALGVLGGAAWRRHGRADTAAVRLRPSGLCVGVGPTQFADLPWTEVTGTRITSIGRAEMLGILVADPKRLLDQQSPGRRALGWMNAKTFGTPVYVPATMVKARLQEVADAIAAYRAAYGGTTIA